MTPLILVCALVCGACAAPAPAPAPGDSGERAKNAVRVIFDAIDELAACSGARPPSPALAALRSKLRDVALDAAGDAALSWQERHEKYSPAVFDALEEHARSAGGVDGALLAVVQLARRAAAAPQQPPAAPDKAAFLLAMRRLFDAAQAPSPSPAPAPWGQPRPHELHREKLHQEKFLSVLESALDDLLP